MVFENLMLSFFRPFILEWFNLHILIRYKMSSTNSSNINLKWVMVERQLYANKPPSRTSLISEEFLPESIK